MESLVEQREFIMLLENYLAVNNDICAKAVLIFIERLDFNDENKEYIKRIIKENGLDINVYEEDVIDYKDLLRNYETLY